MNQNVFGHCTPHQKQQEVIQKAKSYDTSRVLRQTDCITALRRYVYAATKKTARSTKHHVKGRIQSIDLVQSLAEGIKLPENIHLRKVQVLIRCLLQLLLHLLKLAHVLFVKMDAVLYETT